GEHREDVQDRLDYELDIIEQMEYSGYFLIVGDFIREAKDRDILVGPGRGSATGSIVSYLLGISEVDPLEQDLIFERMLNPERASPPDIDLDFPDDRREDIIHYVRERYGDDHCAQVVTFSRLGAKAAVRDVGRVMGLQQEQINAIANAIPQGASLDEAIAQAPELQAIINDGSEQIKELMEYARGVEGLTRHCSVHAAAVVISDRPITDVVPLCASKGTVTTQYSMDDVEACGLVKMDFLGLKTLTIIRRTIDMVRKNHGIEIDILDIPRDDPKAFELLQNGDTLAVFQLESEGMQNLLRKLQPETFGHIVPLVALYRPGPMDSADEFCAGRHGEEINYLHPKLEPILNETYGVILYQEQVMQVASKLAGFSMPQAEIIMRAMAKKQREKMQKMKPLFIEGCVENGIDRGVAQEIFTRMETFSRYGFNKSHSAAYGLVAYWTAYLKANYPAEFLAAQLSTVMDDTDDIAKYINECRRMKLSVEPPSVNRSDVSFSVKDGAVVFGLAAIKGFGVSSARKIVQERRENGPYSGINDLCRRLDGSDLTKSQLKTLVKAGALDEFGERRALLKIHEQAHASGQKHRQDRLVGQNSLFDSFDEEEAVSDTLPDVQPFDEEKKLEMEREFLGLYVSDHPLIRAEERLAECCHCTVEEIEQYPDGTKLRVGGVVADTKTHNSANGLMMFMTLQGISGKCEVTIFANRYEKCRDCIEQGNIVLVDGKVQRRENNTGAGDGPIEPGLLADTVRPLEGARALSDKRRRGAQEARERKARREEALKNPPEPPAVHIEIDCSRMNGRTLSSLRELLSETEGPQPVILRIRDNGTSRHVRLGDRYRVTCNQRLSADSRRIPGVTAVW
ncbi:MAG: DNA polymerase III subunit alpha, partial [Armatimonadota bacterium]